MHDTAAAPVIRGLARDQTQVLALLSSGHSLEEVAEELAYSRRTIVRRLSAARCTLGVTTTAEALTEFRSHRVPATL